MSPGIIANPFAAGIGRKNSLESISSIDRDLSPEELEILQKVSILATTGRMLWSGKNFWKSLVSPLVYGICNIMGSGLPFYGISRSQHFHQECTRMGLWNLCEVTGAPSGKRALGEVALTLVSPRRWKWWEKQLSGREKKWRKWWEIFHVAESVLDSGSAEPVSPKENVTDYLYPVVNAMGGFGPSLFVVHHSVTLAAFWFCHTFLCTSLVVLFCYLQSSSLLPAGNFWPSCNLEKNGLLAWKSHIESVLSVQHSMTWQSFYEQRWEHTAQSCPELKKWHC